MEKIKLLIADDEENIRNILCKVINWESENIVICAKAKDGQDALDKIAEYHPDVILIDIRMPIKTGLEVMEELKKQGSKVKSIILSGYDDFDYAREALKNGAVNYLLKPCRPADILSAIREVKIKIEKEREEEQLFNQMNTELMKNKEEIRNKNLSDLVLTLSGNMMRDCMEKMGVTISEKAFCLIVHPPEQSLFFENQRNVMIEYLEQKLTCIAGSIAENVVAVVNEDPEADKKEVREVLIKFKNFISAKYSMAVSIGVGNLVLSSEGLKDSYENAGKALELVHFLGTDFVMFYDSIYSQTPGMYPSELDADIINAVKKQDMNECNRKIEEFFDFVSKEGKGNIMKSSIAILLSIYHFSLKSGIQTDLIFGRPFEIMNSIGQSKSTGEIIKNMKQKCSLVMEQLSCNMTDNRIINAAVIYMNQNFNRDITLAMVAEEIFITPGYLSTLFKQVTGDSFVNYLNQIRIERACELLRDVKLKNYEVAYQVGFQDEKYFTKVFKKIKGKNPSSFRKEI